MEGRLARNPGQFALSASVTLSYHSAGPIDTVLLTTAGTGKAYIYVAVGAVVKV